MTPTTAPTDAPGASSTPTTIRFPDGLLGFPETREYQLAAGPGDGLFWLVGESDTAPRFLLADPFLYFEGYEVDLPADDVTRIEADDASTIGVLAITVPQSDAPWTANLQGPVVINVDRALGAQVVLTGTEQGVRRTFQPQIAQPI